MSSTSRVIAIVEDRSEENENVDFYSDNDSDPRTGFGAATRPGRVEPDINAEVNGQPASRDYILLYQQMGQSNGYKRQWVIRHDAKPVTGVTFGDDNTLFVESGSLVSAYNVKQRRELWTQQADVNGPLDRIAVNEHEPMIAVYDDREVLLVDAENGIPLSKGFATRGIRAAWWKGDNFMLNSEGKLSIRDAPLPSGLAMKTPYTDELRSAMHVAQ